MRPVSLLLVLLSFTFSLNAYSSLASFNERFEIVQKDGKTVGIRDRSMPLSFSIRPYIEFIKGSILEEQALMASKSDYREEVRSILGEDLDLKDEKSSMLLDTLLESIGSLESYDVEGTFTAPIFRDYIAKVESKMEEALMSLDPTMIARLDDPKFFYNRAVTYQVVKWGLDLAKKTFSTIPLLNTASYVLVEVERMIRNRRTFHQNMLMHYFERYDAKELGLTKEDVDLAWSSIYESRIPWFAKWESNNAVARWDRYGTDNFYAGFRTASSRLRSYRGDYQVLGERVNFAFQEVESNGSRQIVNLVDSSDMFNSRPALAYDYAAPNKVARKRMVLQLAGLGISFISIPQFLKDLGDNYLKSHYESQKLTEGALFGFFEATGDRLMQEELVRQYQNPFDIMLLL